MICHTCNAPVGVPRLGLADTPCEAPPSPVLSAGLAVATSRAGKRPGGRETVQIKVYGTESMQGAVDLEKQGWQVAYK